MDSEPDYDSVPAIAMTQWREGRVLSAEDVRMIERLLKMHDDEMAEHVDAFSAGRDRRQPRHVRGGYAVEDPGERHRRGSCGARRLRQERRGDDRRAASRDREGASAVWTPMCLS